jgi:L-asparaginase II
MDPAIGVDGCGAPVHGVSVAAMATLFARLASPETLGAWGPGAATAVSAMRAFPFLVAGTGRSDTAIMSEAPNVVCKVGAEGLHCAAVLDAGIGVAVRIADGSDRAASPALLRALGLLGVLDERQLERLHRVARPVVRGGGRPVGELVSRFRLRRTSG